MRRIDLSTAGWEGYELLDSGDNRKLERFAGFMVIRPETQAIWRPLRPELWKRADAEFRFAGGKGAWRGKTPPQPWTVSWRNDLKCSLRLTSFKHTGIFPEQEPNWKWIAERVDALAKQRDVGAPENKPKVLSLFGYTGAAGIAAAKHGAMVTHLDASKQSNTWARENAALSNVPDGAFRVITDDAQKFVAREARRGAMYDGIILDPPAFGRGPDGEVWRIEEDIAPLLDAVRKIFAQRPGSFFLLNGYAAGYAPLSFAQAGESAFGAIGHGEFGELSVGEKNSGRAAASGIYVRFVR